MTVIDPSMSLADLVTARPDLAPVLETFGLDYCCGGARSLAEACSAGGLVLDDVVGELGECTPTESEEWASMSAPELVDHLEHTHHVYLRESLPRLGALLERVVDVHGSRHPELGDVAVTFHDLRGDLEPHLMKEEQILFPMVRELYAADEMPTFHCGSLRNPIGVMGVEHDRAGALLARLRALTAVYTPPSDGCASYHALYAGLAELEADTHMHVHKENNVLFPLIVAEELRLSMK